MGVASDISARRVAGPDPVGDTNPDDGKAEQGKGLVERRQRRKAGHLHHVAANELDL